jgi:hypothetical protein
MRFTRDERQAGRKRLTQWQTPAEMRLDAEKLMDQLGSEDLFNQGGLEFVREAWLAAEFANQRDVLWIRLNPGNRPDIDLLFVNGAAEAFEAVEAGADVDGPRGDKYKRIASSGQNVTHSDVEEWATPEQAREVLQAAAETKARKARDLAGKGTPYPPGTKLLIYLNISDYGVNHEAIKNEFAASVQVATPWFSTIWILWKGVAYRVFDNAETIIEP